MLIFLAMIATMASCERIDHGHPKSVPVHFHSATASLCDYAQVEEGDDDDDAGKAYGDACETAEKAGAT